MNSPLDELRGRRVYLDANVLIYFLDGTPPRAGEAAVVLRAAADRTFRAVTGHAAVAEVMVGPYRTGDPFMIRSVRAFIAQPGLLEVVAHTTAIFDDAAMLRATAGLPFIDALHLATAAGAGCEVIITNDKRMKPALGVEVLPLRAFAG